MDPNLLVAALEAAIRLAATYPAIRETLNTTDQARLDALFAQSTDDRNAIAGQLRETPDKA